MSDAQDPSTSPEVAAALRKLNALGERQGFLTYSQIGSYVPEELMRPVAEKLNVRLFSDYAVPGRWLVHKGKGRRTVKTARTLEEINAGVDAGLWPLVKRVVPGPQVHAMTSIYQDPATGRVETSADLRYRPDGDEIFEPFYYYPYSFPAPYAAYLLPRDLKAGEEVWLDDLIEDVVMEWGNQGFNPRLPAAVAIWDGRDFAIDYDPTDDGPQLIG